MTILRRMAALTFAIAFSLTGTMSHAAATRAQSDRAEALHEAGRRILQSGDAIRALPLLEEAHKVLRRPTTAYDLMQVCFELHKYVEGWQVGDEVSRVPPSPDDPSEFANARANISDAMRLLDKDIPRMVLHFTGAPQELIAVTVDDQVLTQGELKQPYRVNPGKHRVEVRANGCLPVQPRWLSMFEAMDYPVNFDLVPISKPHTQSLTWAKPPEVSTAVKISWILGGILGGASVGTGVGASVSYRSAADALYGNGCGDVQRCSDVYESKASTLQGLTTATLMTGVVGLGMLGYAIYGSFSHPKKRVGIRLVPSLNGAVLMGAF